MRTVALLMALMMVVLSGCSSPRIQCGADLAAIMAEGQAQESPFAFAESEVSADVVLRLTLRVDGEDPKEVRVALRRKPSGEKAAPIQKKLEVHLGSGIAAIEAQALFISLTSFWGGPDLYGSNTLNFRARYHSPSEIDHAGVRVEARWEERPNKSPEPTLTARPFSVMTAALETPSSLWVSVAHL